MSDDNAQESEVSQLRSIRDRLVKAIIVATGATDEEVRSGPLSVAKHHAAEITRLHVQRDQLLAALKRIETAPAGTSQIIRAIARAAMEEKL